MCKTSKQMLDNKVIKIFILIWLMKQHQLDLCDAGKPTQTMTVTLITDSQQHLSAKPFIRKDEEEHYSSESNSNNITTIASSNNTASNKLNVNNTDTQMTLKLKDATARNACVTNYLKCLILPAPATEASNDLNTTPNCNKKAKSTTTNTTRSFVPAAKTFLGGQLIPNLLRSPPETTTTITYLQHKENFIVKGTTKHLNKAAASTTQTAANNLIKNNNLINKKDFSLLQEIKNINKGLRSRISKDKQVNYGKRKTDKGLIEKGAFLQAANESSEAAGVKASDKQKKQNTLTEKEKATQTILNKLSVKENERKHNNFEKKQNKKQSTSDEANTGQLILSNFAGKHFNEIEDSKHVNNFTVMAFAVREQKNFSEVHGKTEKFKTFQSTAFDAQPQLPKEQVTKSVLKQEPKAEKIPAELKKAKLKFNNLKLLHTKINKLKKEEEKPREPESKTIKKIFYSTKSEQNYKFNENENLTIKIEQENGDIKSSRTNEKFTERQQQICAGNTKQRNTHKTLKNISIENAAAKTEIPFTTTFRRQKRLNNNKLEQINSLQLKTLFQKSQNENSTEINHHHLPEKKSLNFNSTIFKQNVEITTPQKTDVHSVASENKMPIEFKNESVEMETENLRKLNLINKQEKLAVSGNGNSMMPINNTINNKQLNGSLIKNINFIDNGKQIVKEINDLSVNMSNKSVDDKLLISLAEEKTTATTNAILLTSPIIDNVSLAVVTQQNLFDLHPTIKANESSASSLIQSNNLRNSIAETHEYTTQDFINTKLSSIDEEMQLVFTTLSTTTTKLYDTTIQSLISASTGDAAAGFLGSTIATTTSTTASPSWPVKHASVMEGNVILGGLMMVHSREDSITCGPIMPQGGIQALEAMLYTLDQVNKQNLLPNITLGAHILDDCDKDTYGLEMAVDFIKGKSIIKFS